MSPEIPFAELIQRVRAGDEAAATQLWTRYEPEIRRVVRLRLHDARLRRAFDSMDICQSVLGNFFVRVAAGQFDVDEPQQLIKLLVRMARNKLGDYARRQRADRRDQRRVAHDPAMLEAVADAGETPSQIVAGRELLQAVRAGLSAEERRIAALRAAGRNWDEIARQLGGSAEALRKQLARAVDRVGRQLGLDEVPDK